MTLPLLPRYYTKTAVLERPMDKIPFTGRIISVKARIRLIRSFDQIPTHQYQGYTLILDGEIDIVPRSRFKVAIGPNPHYSRSFCSKRGYAAATGRLAVQPFNILHEYASGLHVSACPSRFASTRFRDEPS